MTAKKGFLQATWEKCVGGLCGSLKAMDELMENQTAKKGIRWKLKLAGNACQAFSFACAAKTTEKVSWLVRRPVNYNGLDRSIYPGLPKPPSA